MAAPSKHPLGADILHHEATAFAGFRVSGKTLCGPRRPPSLKLGSVASAACGVCGSAGRVEHFCHLLIILARWQVDGLWSKKYLPLPLTWGSLSFEDVAVDFTREEWQFLDWSQKVLYKEVMLENYSNLVSVGYQGTKPDSLFKLEQGEPPWIVEGAAHSQTCPGFVIQNRRYTGKDSDAFGGYGKSCLHIKRDKTLTEVKYHRCVKPTSPKSQLNDHQKICVGEKPHECSVCGRAFSRKAQLIQHQRTERGEKPHGCGECGKTFMRKIQLTEHQRTHTGEKPHECSECGKAFSRKSQLMVHQRTHTGEKPYRCSECGKAFSRKCRLNRHQRSHTGEKLYGCSVCGKAFSQKAYLIAHQRLHTGEKPYKCSDCGRTFYFKSDLTRHQRIHTGEKPYECHECEKAFRSKSKLIQHQRTHTGERPYSCSECGKAFAHMSVLIKHKKTHIREKAIHSLKVEKPSSRSHTSLYMSEHMQEQKTVPIEMPASGTPALLNKSERLVGRNVVIVEQPFPRNQAFVVNQEFEQGISLANEVNVAPSVINYILYVTDIV
uniref:zinc finger protein 577 isoform X1 n=1 Tax=Macaca mulatta TaxID=9544 RepID=UPI0010A21AA2|nr:zinc finger protein 577 isoform X1 [Macaca mulatta]